MPLSSDQQAEIDQARGGAQPTLRPISPALEEILFQALPVLDHGFVRVVYYMGDDAARRPRPPQPPAAASPPAPVQNARDQAPREAADFRGPPVDPPSHRQRERILGALLDPRQRALRAHARAPAGPEQRP